jgi:2-polyprenyl-6-methoxyphenol hydroxylase-like FAD-dependent oxidoreductase
MESSGKGPKQLHILIVGAGLGGIMLGVMLEHANISYQILERSSDIRPQGSAISIGPTVMRVMAQLGLMEELLRESKPIRRLRFFNKMDVDLDPNQHDGEADMMFCEERYVFKAILRTRRHIHGVRVFILTIFFPHPSAQIWTCDPSYPTAHTLPHFAFAHSS